MHVGLELVSEIKFNIFVKQKSDALQCRFFNGLIEFKFLLENKIDNLSSRLIIQNLK